MPLRILRLRGLVNASLVRGLLVTGMYSTFFLGTLYLEHVRHYGALQTGAAFLPWTLTVAVLSRGITAALVEALRGACGAHRRDDHRGRSGWCCSARVGPAHRVLPDDLPRQLRDRPRHRQRVHAAADAGDGGRPRGRRRARLGHHQRLAADRRRARTGRSQHRGHQPHQGPPGRPPRPRHLADQRLPRRVPRGRRSDRRRVLLAFALLRPRARRPELQLAPDEAIPVPANAGLEQQAA